jgi:DNA-binding MarR family transcriptional regulator
MVADSLDRRYAQSLLLVARLVQQRLATRLEPADVSVSQFGLLHHVAGRPGVNSGELARLLGYTPQAASVAVRDLTRRGWIDRESHGQRGKRIALRLTETGARHHARALAVVLEFEDEISALVGGLMTHDRLVDDLHGAWARIDAGTQPA